MTAEDEGRHVFDGNIKFLRQEETESRTVQHAGHADYPVVRQATRIAENADHHVQRIGDADNEGFRTVLLDAGAHLPHHVRVDTDQVVTAHSRLARHAGGDDDHVGVAKSGITVCARDRRVEGFDSRRLLEVQRLALRHTFHDIEKDDVAKLFQSCEKRQRTADLAGADECDLVSCHEKLPVSFVARALPEDRQGFRRPAAAKSMNSARVLQRFRGQGKRAR